MNKITDQEYKQAMINVNHGTDNMVKGFIRLDEQHKLILIEMKDQKQETILLRTVTNKLITNMGKNNRDIMIAMIGIVGTALGVCLAIIKFL